MREKIKEALDKLVELKWITLNKKINKEAMIIVIEEFVKEISLVDFIRWIKNS